MSRQIIFIFTFLVALALANAASVPPRNPAISRALEASLREKYDQLWHEAVREIDLLKNSYVSRVDKVELENSQFNDNDTTEKTSDTLARLIVRLTAELEALKKDIAEADELDQSNPENAELSRELRKKYEKKWNDGKLELEAVESYWRYRVDETKEPDHRIVPTYDYEYVTKVNNEWIEKLKALKLRINTLTEQNDPAYKAEESALREMYDQEREKAIKEMEELKNGLSAKITEDVVRVDVSTDAADSLNSLINYYNTRLGDLKSRIEELAYENSQYY